MTIGDDAGACAVVVVCGGVEICIGGRTGDGGHAMNTNEL